MGDIPINAQVNCSDGPCGHSTYLIANPVQRRITSVGQDTVWLKIDRKAVGALPAVPLKRRSD